jgi:Icc-related predicted phosphoesterase
MKIWHFSDTHDCHEQLDSSNPRDPFANEPQVRRFITWYDSLPIKHKIYVPGNHDTSIEKGFVTKQNFKDLGIHYLENDFVVIEGLKIWGSPCTPEFGMGWAFNRSRDKIYKVWKHIPEDTDILATHGPPKGILDKTLNRENVFEMVGDSSLMKRIWGLNLKAVLFGHIHNGRDYPWNAGVLKLSGFPTIFSNGACCTDGKWGEITSNGNILDL